MKEVRKVISAVTFLTLAACVSAPPDLKDNQIVPGARVSNVELGMSLSDLLSLQGKPSRTIPIAHTNATSYTFDGLTVAADDKVYWIIAHDPRFFTDRGVSMGSEQIFARGTYGKPKCVVTRDTVTVYDYGNIYFEVNNATGKVGQIGIQRSTQTCGGAS
jgi:hypothetical protein